MQQLEIQYFFPLEEQIPLDLDYEPSIEYAKELNRKRCAEQVTLSGQYLLAGNGLTGATTWTSINQNLGNPSFTINIDALPITIQSKKKPNIFRRYIYKILGMKWKAE